MFRYITTAAIFGLLLSGCATTNYTFKGRPCENVLETNEDVVLKCTKVDRPHHEPREYGGRFQ